MSAKKKAGKKAPKRAKKANDKSRKVGESAPGRDEDRIAPNADDEQLFETLTTTDVAAEWVPIASLVPWKSNPRKINQAHVSDVAHLVIRLGWSSPIVAAQDSRTIVAGHTRRLAALKLAEMWNGATDRERGVWHPDAVRVALSGEVPVRFGEWSDHDAKLLAVADNRQTELGEWDMDLLPDVLSEFSLDDVDIAGWSSEDLEKMGSDLLAGADDKDDVDASEEPTELGFKILVECSGEQHQVEVFEQLEELGLKCRPLMS